jgi:mannose-1-phosphate guanylyltransferase
VAAREDAIVTIGIVPTFPSTGFGYIEAGEPLETGTATAFLRARRFVEKPDAATEARYVAEGRHFWNAGMFIWRAGVMRDALARHAPRLREFADKIEAAPLGAVDGILEAVYPTLPRISVDFAIMEKAERIIMARGAFGWDDVGTWAAVGNHLPADAAGNVIVGQCEAVEASDNVVISEGRLTALLGVRDLVVVHAANATLVCARDRVQDVKKVVQRVSQRPDGARYV